MNRPFFNVSLFLAITLFSVMTFAQENTVNKSNVRTLRIDPNAAKGGSMLQVFSEITYIPLETTKESLFGDITQLEVSEDNYIIYDNDTKCILIFEKNGKFRVKIELKKVVEGAALNSENLDVYGFSLKKSSSDCIILVYVAGKLYAFDTNAKRINESIAEKQKHRASQFYNFKGDTKVVSYYQDSKGKDKSLYQYALIKNGNLFAKYFEIDTGKYSKSGDFAVGGPSFIETDSPDILHAVRYYDYNIYRIDSEGISAAYELIFPAKNTIPKDFNTNKVYFGKKINHFFKNVENIYGIGYTFKIGDFLYFKCGSLSSYIRRNGSFVYDLKNDNLISLNRLDPDSLSRHLPIIGAWDNDFKKFDGKHLYASLSSLELFSYYNQEKKKNYKYPEVMQNYFNKGSKKDNPVIIKLTPKN